MSSRYALVGSSGSRPFIKGVLAGPSLCVPVRSQNAKPNLSAERVGLAGCGNSLTPKPL